jgi:pimeloyl-ACP methyl ester carboxylesterase
MRFWLLVACSALLACGDDSDDRPGPAAPADGSTAAPVDGGTPRDGSLAPMDASLPVAPPDGSAPDATVPDATVPSALTWQDCGGDAGYQCATLPVPVSYGDANSRNITLALARRPASGQRSGSLVWNPGGPGSSAIDNLPDLVSGLSADVRARFDIVALDPRGVGYSDPITCHSKLQALFAADPSPDDEQEWTALDAVSAQFAAECGSKYGGDLLASLGTVNATRDLERLRQALGEDKLNFLGFSYGTELGAQYARLFPEHVGRLVLDGPVDPALSPIEQSLAQAKGFEQSLANYFAWCSQQPTRCSWTGGQDPAAAFAALQAQVEQAPLPSSNWDRPCGPGELVQGVVTPLYAGEPGWRILSEDLQVAVDGDGTNLVINTDIYLERDVEQHDGEYGNISEANFAVDCLDAAPITVAEIRAQEAAFRSAAPVFGVPSLTHLLVCAHWPASGATPPVPSNVTSPPILVIGTTQDPATPYAWAQQTAATLGAAAHLLTYDGEGHTAYARNIPCIDSAVDAYLLSGTLPADGTRCGALPAMALVHGGGQLRTKLPRRWR